MYTIADLQRITGYSPDQVRDRLRSLQPVLGEHVHRGSRGKVLVGDAVVASLRRMVELEGSGLSPKVAVGEVVRELGNGQGSGSSTVGHGEPAGEVRALREALEDCRRERDHWRELALSLQTQALPGSRRPWWALWRR